VKRESRWFGTNQLETANGTIAQFNSLTSACGSNTAPAGVTLGSVYNGCIAGETPASPCYSGGGPVSCSTAGAIQNPYYNIPKQSLLDASGWYPGGDTGLDPVNNPSTSYFDTPLTTALILNYRHDKFAITPSFQLIAGSSYGGPMDVMGVDPRACGANSATDGITAVSPNTNPLQCDYLSQTGGNGAFYAKSANLFIPNPQTGSFAKPGQFRGPNLFLMNLMLSYDISPKVTAQVTLANIYHRCFGGASQPWTKAYAPSANVCGYAPASFYYISNAYNGTSPNDTAANGFTPQTWQLQSYVPQTFGSDAAYVPMPFNAYFQLNIKL